MSAEWYSAVTITVYNLECYIPVGLLNFDISDGFNTLFITNKKGCQGCVSLVPHDGAGPGVGVHPAGAGQLPHRHSHHLLLRRQEAAQAQTEGGSPGGHQVCNICFKTRVHNVHKQLLLIPGTLPFHPQSYC